MNGGRHVRGMRSFPTCWQVMTHEQASKVTDLSSLKSMTAKTVSSLKSYLKFKTWCTLVTWDLTSSPSHHGSPITMIVVVCLQKFLAGNLGRRCPVKTLVNHNKYLIIIIFSAARHNNVVSFCICFESSDLLASHKLANQV